MFPIENHLISPKNLFELNPKQLQINYRKRMGPLPFLSLADAMERRRRGALHATAAAAAIPETH
jgi:hypothetical protein